MPGVGNAIRFITIASTVLLIAIHQTPTTGALEQPLATRLIIGDPFSSFGADIYWQGISGEMRNRRNMIRNQLDHNMLDDAITNAKQLIAMLSKGQANTISMLLFQQSVVMQLMRGETMRGRYLIALLEGTNFEAFCAQFKADQARRAAKGLVVDPILLGGCPATQHIRALIKQIDAHVFGTEDPNRVFGVNDVSDEIGTNEILLNDYVVDILDKLDPNKSRWMLKEPLAYVKKLHAFASEMAPGVRPRYPNRNGPSDRVGQGPRESPSPRLYTSSQPPRASSTYRRQSSSTAGSPPIWHGDRMPTHRPADRWDSFTRAQAEAASGPSAGQSKQQSVPNPEATASQMDTTTMQQQQQVANDDIQLYADLREQARLLSECEEQSGGCTESDSMRIKLSLAAIEAKIGTYFRRLKLNRTMAASKLTKALRQAKLQLHPDKNISLNAAQSVYMRGIFDLVEKKYSELIGISY